MRAKKGEVPKSTRHRTPEQDELLREVRHYQARMRMRIGLGNQIAAVIRQGLAPESEAARFAAEHTKPLEHDEHEIIRAAAKKIKGMPIWEQWLRHVRGIGDVLAVQLIAHIQPVADFPNVAKLWAYSGYAVKDGKAVKRTRGVKSNWNSAFKLLGFQVGDCFVRCGGPYRELYNFYKARDKERHPEPIARKSKDGETYNDYSDGHLHNRARRYAVKIFLSHLWQAWRELEGLPVPGPYAIEFMPGHTHVLSPWSFIGREVADEVVVG